MNFQQVFNQLLTFAGKNFIVIVFVTVTVGGWILRQIKAQKEKTAVVRNQQRRQLEELRTGRMEPKAFPQPTPARAPVPPPSAQASLEEIAARRRAKIDEAQRRRAQAPIQVQDSRGRTQPASPTLGKPSASVPPQTAQQELGRLLGQILGVPGAGGPMGRQPNSNIPPSTARRPPQRSFPPRLPQKQPSQQRTPQRPVQVPPRAAPPAQRHSTANTPQAAAHAHRLNVAPRHDQNAPAFSYGIGESSSPRLNRSAPDRTTTPSHPLFAGADFRKLFVIREVLDKPIALREHD